MEKQDLSGPSLTWAVLKNNKQLLKIYDRKVHVTALYLLSKLIIQRIQILYHENIIDELDIIDNTCWRNDL